MLTTPILVSLITPAGEGQLLPNKSAALATVWLDPGSGVVALVGELDSSNAGSVGAALGAQVAGGKDLVLNLAELDFMDCSGVRVLVSLAAGLSQGGGRLVLDAPHRIVRRVMTLTKVDEHPNISIQEGEAGPAGGFAARRGIVQLT